ncbi:MAG: TonB-dependent receptor [Chitinophagaceae bacterium]|nr:TonB-dependent receptor [Chitinophagaceae bacterium]
MNKLFCLLLTTLLTAAMAPLCAQETITIRIADKTTREAIPGATITTADGKTYTTNDKGEIILNSSVTTCTIMGIGYASRTVDISKGPHLIMMEPQAANMQQVIVTANRQVQQRNAAPIAISTISASTINDTKATTIDQLVNKTPGVFMVNLGNEQHMMSIRQPMSTKGLYLYLEDGIPIRTSGVFNHNALLEINMTAVKNIEIIRGPSSSMYGAEAIGGAINFITRSAPVQPMARVAIQGNNTGYSRADLSTGASFGKLGISFNGYFAQNNNCILERSDFKKWTGTLRADYLFSDKTKLITSITALDYYSDMRGSLDSAAFRNKDYSTPQTFTWRKVNALRFKTQLDHTWRNGSSTSIALIYRDNSVAQNPSYRVKDDFRRSGSNWTGKKSLAHGEINDNSFNSYAAVITHQQKWLNGKLNSVSGLSLDLSPSTYNAYYIRIDQDTVNRKYLSFTERPDSLLSHYFTNISNGAAFTQLEYRLTENLRLIGGLRFDLFRLAFRNYLPPSAFSGSPNTTETYKRFTPKAGITWQPVKAIGFYANYSEGFVAPQITELFNGVKVPDLKPQTFYNYEAGGWISLFQGKIYADWSLYYLQGTNEIISIRFDDGSSGNANAGKTKHQGIEYGLSFRPTREWMLRFSGTNSSHRFVNYAEKGISYNGKTMNGAPAFTGNAELQYKPNWLPGFRTGIEWQHNGSYWMDPQNTVRDPGFNLLNLRAGYEWKAFEVWCNVINLTDNYYSINTSKSAYGYAYTVGNPQSFNIGIVYTITAKKK